MSKFKCLEPEPPFFVCSRYRSRPHLAGVGSGTLDFRSQCQMRLKKWQLHNTVFWNKKFELFLTFNVDQQKTEM